MLFRSLPLCLLLIITQASVTIAGPRAILERAHRIALRHSKGLADDLRVAFGAVPPKKRLSGRVLMKRGVYCVAGPSNSGLSHGGSGNGNGNHGNGGGGTTNAGNGTSISPGSSRGTTTRTSTSSPPVSTNVPPSSWKLAESHEGNDFFNGWDFFTNADPTNGSVQYVDEGTGRAAGLVAINSAGNAIMGIETTPNVPNNRMSVRITTRSRWNGGGLFLLDAVHMPTGCGTWPAWWSNGPNWPNGGEIDIVEGVHDYTNNQATLHTSAGCSLPTRDSSSLRISGSLVSKQDCGVSQNSNEGCGIRAPSDNSFGAGFNRAGGGVYAMLWDSNGIAVYFFPRGSIPADITAEAPQPSNWGLPQARFPASSCDPFRFFTDQSLIFTNTLCGDWASGVWNSAGVPGQEQSCAQRTGFPTCEAFVRASGGSFSQAYWEVRNVKLYQNRK